METSIISNIELSNKYKIYPYFKFLLLNIGSSFNSLNKSLTKRNFIYRYYYLVYFISRHPFPVNKVGKAPR